MRASSRTRSSPSTARMSVAVTPCAVSGDLSTTRWVSANAATCARWVTTTTWCSRASRASRRPISPAAWPPTPASTSSNTITGTGSAPAKTTSMASITRESSPPEAPLCTGRGGAPGGGAGRRASPPGSRSTAGGRRGAGRQREQQGDLVEALGPGLVGVGLDREGHPRALHGQPGELVAHLGGEPLGCGAAAGGELPAQLVDLRAGRVAFSGQLLQRLVGDVELLQPVAGLLGPPQ